MSETYLVKVDGRTLTVAIEDAETGPDGDQLGAKSGAKSGGMIRAVVDGRELILDVRALGAGAWSFVGGGPDGGAAAARTVHVDGAPPKLTIEVSHPDGEPRRSTVELTSSREAGAAPRGAAAAKAGAAVTLRAPIPGKLVKVLVKAGDRIVVGQALLVLEAMKMENELRAPHDGVVSAVHVGEGTAVETGQDLITLG